MNQPVKTASDASTDLFGSGVTLGTRYEPTTASISFIKDHSLSVRREAAEYIRRNAREFIALSSELIEVIISEPDPQVTISLIESLPRMNCSTERAVPALIYLLSDNRSAVANTSAKTLGLLGDAAIGAYIPLSVLSRGVWSPTNDPRALAFESSLSSAGKVAYAEATSCLGDHIAQGRRDLRQRLREALAAEPQDAANFPAHTIAIALSLGSDSDRSLASRLWVKRSRSASGDATSFALIEGALAFTAPEIQRAATSDATKDLFFEVCRETRPGSGLEFIVSSFMVTDAPYVESTRDFTTVYLSNGELCETTIRNMCESLLYAEPSTCLAIATNLGVLAKQLPYRMAVHVVDSLFDALSVRAVEGPSVTSALVAGIATLTEFEAPVMSGCERLVAAKLGPTVDQSVLQILEGATFNKPQESSRRTHLIRYLDGP